jgi:ParB-like nuclease domain
MPPTPIDDRVLEWVPLDKLLNHPLNAQLYGTQPDEEFVAGIKAYGVIVPPEVTIDFTIISGHRRVQAAKIAGHLGIWVLRHKNAMSDLEVQKRLILANAQRPKDDELKLREYRKLREIETALAAERKRSGKAVGDGQKHGEARALAAEGAGVSASTGDLGVALLDHLDAADTAGDTERAAKIRTTLHKSGVRPALKVATEGSNPQPKTKSNKRSGTDNHQALPPKLKPIFATADDFSAAEKKAHSLKGDVRKLKKTQAGADINLTDFELDLDKATRAFALEVPTALCKACGGKGCDQCDGKGWRNRRQCAGASVTETAGGEP